MNENIKKKDNIYDYLIKFENRKLYSNNKLNSFFQSISCKMINDEVLIRIIRNILKEILNIDRKVFKKINKVSQIIQTEIEVINLTDFNKLHENYERDVLELKNKINLISLQYEKLELLNTKILNEKDNIERKYKELENNYNLLKKENEKIMKEKYNIIIENDLNIKKISNKEKYIEELEKFSQDKKFYSDDYEIKTSNIFENNKILYNLCKFLTPKEIYCLKNSSKKLYMLIDSHTHISKFLFYRIINEKNNVIKSLRRSLDPDISSIENYDIDNIIRIKDDEKLFKEFSNIVLKAYNFIKSEIKFNQKYKSSDNRNYLQEVTNLVSGILNSTSNFINNKGSCSTSEKSNNSSYSDNFKYIETENNFKSSSEIKNIIYTYIFRLIEMNNTDQFKKILEELCIIFSELVFNSNDILREFFEISTTKNNQSNTIKELRKEIKIMENNVVTLKSNLHSMNLAYEYLKYNYNEHKLKNEISTKEKSNDEGLHIIMNQLKSKLEEIESDYCYYRFISKREIEDLKYDLSTVINERNQLRKELLGLRLWFESLSI